MQSVKRQYRKTWRFRAKSMLAATCISALAVLLILAVSNATFDLIVFLIDLSCLIILFVASVTHMHRTIR